MYASGPARISAISTAAPPLRCCCCALVGGEGGDSARAARAARAAVNAEEEEMLSHWFYTTTSSHCNGQCSTAIPKAVGGCGHGRTHAFLNSTHIHTRTERVILLDREKKRDHSSIQWIICVSNGHRCFKLHHKQNLIQKTHTVSQLTHN